MFMNIKKNTHGGANRGQGRKPAPYPKRLKGFRPSSKKEWQEFLSYLSGDLVEDFEMVLSALRASRSLTLHESDKAIRPQNSEVESK